MNQKLKWMLYSQVFALAFGLATNLSGQVFGQELSGAWSGCWQSEANGHRGRISAEFRQVSPCQLEARFRGTFAKVIPFRYRTRLAIVHQEPGLMVLGGSRRLPISGEFRYEAVIANGQFRGQFFSPRNRGTWNMTRR